MMGGVVHKYFPGCYCFEESEVNEILKVPEHWNDIFAAALHSITVENSVAQDMPFWCFHNYCGLNSPLYSNEMSRLYGYISGDPESIPDFMYRFREGYFGTFPDSGTTLVGFDSTNQNTNSRGIDLAEYDMPR